MTSVPDKKPNVRVIPIEVEGVDSRSPRHRTYSGPADTLTDRCDDLASERIERFPFKRYFEDLPKPSKPKLNAEPRVYNIPIQVEGANNVQRNSQPKIVPKSPKPKVDASPKPKRAAPTANNGCSQSKLPSKDKSLKKDDKVQSEPNENEVDQSKNYVEISLKKIEDILTEFKTYETGVLEFTGTSKDKQFRYLDEMLTRCMLRLDDIVTMGHEEIRLARKNAVKKVQASIDLLENKTSVQPVTSTEIPKVQSTSDENIVENNDDNDVEMQDNAVTSTENVTSSEIKEMDLTQSDNKDQNKAADTIINSDVKTETGSKIESTEVTLENTNNVTDIEMSEVPQEKADDVMRDEENLTLQHQQNSMPEIEMTEGISSDKVNSTKDAQSSELLGSDSKVTAQIEVLSETPSNDVDMLDDSTSTEVNESLEESAENICNVNKSSEIFEVEMVDAQDISSEKSEKECETVEKSVDPNSECLELETNNELDPKDNVSPKDSPSTLDNVNDASGDKCIAELPEQDVKCASSQSEKDKTLNTDLK